MSPSAAIPMQFSDHEHIAPLAPLDADEVFSRIQIMVRQEDGPYRCGYYMRKPHRRRCPSDRRDSRTSRPVDEACRTRMSVWCYQISDYCNFRREVVAVAMNFLDRYLQTDSPVAAAALRDRKMFQLASMTALYTAVKIIEPEVMEPGIVAGLSRGNYTQKDITDMESRMLTALEWRVQPPTALAYVQHLVALLPHDDKDFDSQTSLYDFAKFLTELAVIDPHFVGVRPSIVAFASFLSAVEVTDRQCLPTSDRLSLLQVLTWALGIETSDPAVTESRRRLLNAFSESAGSELPAVLSNKAASSPRSVFDVLQQEHKKHQASYSPRCVSAQESSAKRWLSDNAN